MSVLSSVHFAWCLRDGRSEFGCPYDHVSAGQLGDGQPRAISLWMCLTIFLSWSGSRFTMQVSCLGVPGGDDWLHHGMAASTPLLSCVEMGMTAWSLIDLTVSRAAIVVHTLAGLGAAQPCIVIGSWLSRCGAVAFWPVIPMAG